MRNSLKALLTVSIFSLSFGALADYSNDGDYEGVGSRGGVDGPMTAEECHPYPLNQDGTCRWPEGRDGGEGGEGPAAAPDSGPAPDADPDPGPSPDSPGGETGQY